MRRPALAAWLASVACGGSTPAPMDDGSSTTSSIGDTTALGSTTEADTSNDAVSTGADDTTTAAGSSSGDTSSFPVPVCGDGIVEGDEECDDRNREPDDGCDNVCNHAGVVEWTVIVDGPASGNDRARAVAVEPTGDVWVAGTVDAGDTVVRLRRYAPGGRLVAELELASGGTDDVRDLAIDDTGALYVAGSSLALGVDQAWVAKLDASGTELWRYTRPAAADTATVVARGVALGGTAIYVLGHEERTSKTVDLDAWIVALDPEGALQWEHPYPGDAGEDAFAAAIAVAADDTVVAVGAETRPGQAFDGWIRKLDADGAEVWTVAEVGVMGSATEETLRAVAATDDGGVVVTGLVDDLDGPRIWTRRYGASGTTEWTRTYAGPDGVTQGGRAVALDPRGDIAITGAVGIVGQSNDVIVRRYSADGDFELWTSYYNDPRANLDDVGHAVAVANDGSVYVAGETLVTGRGSDWWIRKYAAR